MCAEELSNNIRAAVALLGDVRAVVGQVLTAFTTASIIIFHNIAVIKKPQLLFVFVVSPLKRSGAL